MMTNCALDILSNSLMRWIPCIWHKFQGSRERRSLRASVKIPAQSTWHVEILPPSIFACFFNSTFENSNSRGRPCTPLACPKDWQLWKQNHEMSSFGNRFANFPLTHYFFWHKAPLTPPKIVKQKSKETNINLRWEKMKKKTNSTS